MTTRPIPPAGPYPHDAAAPTPPWRLIPGAVPWRERRLSCPVAATLLACDATDAEAADVYAAHHATMQAALAHLTAYALDDPWEDIGECVAIRRERGRVVEVRDTAFHTRDNVLFAALRAEAHAGVTFADHGPWVYMREPGKPVVWHMRVREQR